MTKDELEKEAEEWAKDHHYYNGTVKGYVAERDSVINSYLAGAEPREKRIAELEQQIEKMKSTLIDIRSNTDDVNIEWQIKYLFDELEIKENGK